MQQTGSTLAFMKKTLALLAALACFVPIPVFAVEPYAAISAELIEMFDKEQKIRFLSTDDPEVRKEMDAIDAHNTKRLNAIIKEIGWPTVDKVGKHASRGAFYISQHAYYDRPLMEFAFKNIEAEYKAGIFPGNLYAMMYDRLKTMDGKPQKYGTQIQTDHTGCFVVELENPEKVDIYRREVGIKMDLATYKEKVCAMP
ncbi:hypothetical protein GCM10011396_08960 [Undibacterium terreum]|uniref:DUF4019 domain-containing protein n=2 Tax=Undibacterium terreum TaxID=1224302 RepID=A0A916U874_9BURK|nr:hypothetical protein GCM10011396_08960 [Undibacterium terreum]